MSTPVLTYFGARGLGETIRLMFTAANVQMDKLRNDGLLMFGQVPLVQYDGMNMVQSMAIVRYIAHKYNLGGKDYKEAFKVDMMTEGARDFLMAFIRHKFIPDDTFKEISEKAMERYMPIFEKELNGQFLVGNSLTMADVCLFEVLLFVEEFANEKFDNYPNLSAFCSRLKNMPNFAVYLNGDRRSPLNTEEYVEMVKKVLGW